MSHPPTPTAIPILKSIHHDDYIESFQWIEEIDHPQTLPYLEAENQFTEERLNPLQALREEIEKELDSRIASLDQTAPYTIGEWTRFSTIRREQSYWVHNRQHQNGSIECLLDENKEAEGEDYYHLEALSLNPAQTHMACLEDRNGSERFTLWIENLSTGIRTSIKHATIKWTIAWLDDDSLLYVCGDDTDRPCEIRLYNTQTTDDVQLWVEEDAHFYLTVKRGRCADRVYCQAHSKTTSEIWVIEPNRETVNSKWKFYCIQQRQHGVKYTIAQNRICTWLRSNHERSDFAIYKQTKPEGPLEPYYIPPEGVCIEAIDLMSQHLLCWVREKGLQSIHVLHLSNHTCSQFTFPDPVYEIYEDINPLFESTVFRLRYTSPVLPDTVLLYNIETGDYRHVHQFAVANYTPSKYQCQRIWITNSDGVQIPISIVERCDLPKNTCHPFLLYGYGAYGVSYDAGFQSDWISLLDRGFRVGIAHVRGGGELGRDWYQQGKQTFKQNSFSDFIACAEFLIEAQWTTADQLIIRGGSAGGLLMAAVLNQRPDLFGGCVAEVPFVDIINTMLNPTLPLTVIEYEEWGNPNNPDDYAVMRAYDPYRQYHGQVYPPLLATGGLQDPRVGYWEPAKWIAKIRQHHPQAGHCLLRINMSAGHGGASGREEAHKEDAYALAFILNCIQFQ